jgi:hypothetical protein
MQLLEEQVHNSLHTGWGKWVSLLSFIGLFTVLPELVRIILAHMQEYKGNHLCEYSQGCVLYPHNRDNKWCVDCLQWGDVFGVPGKASIFLAVPDK